MFQGCSSPKGPLEGLEVSGRTQDLDDVGGTEVPPSHPTLFLGTPSTGPLNRACPVLPPTPTPEFMVLGHKLPVPQACQPSTGATFRQCPQRPLG